MHKLLLYKEAKTRWGAFSQLFMLSEECVELSHAVHKLTRKRSYENFEKLFEEMADVQIMLEQIELMYPANSIDAYKKQKLKRLEELLTRKGEDE